MQKAMKKYYDKNADKLKKNVSMNVIKKRIQPKFPDETQLNTLSNLIYYLNLSHKFLNTDQKKLIKDLKISIQGKQIKNRRTKQEIENEKKITVENKII